MKEGKYYKTKACLSGTSLWLFKKKTQYTLKLQYYFQTTAAELVQGVLHPSFPTKKADAELLEILLKK